MGTRAAFWVGDPRDLEHREWLGCVAWDGDSWRDDEGWATITTEQQFRGAVDIVKEQREDFADPEHGGWPYPWPDDIFLTDFTYAFFDGAVHYTVFYCSFVKVGEELPESRDDDPSMKNVPGPSARYDRSQPDSIMIVTARQVSR